MLSAIWIGLGLVVTKALARTWVGTVDHQFASWLAEDRTPLLNELSRIGSMLGQTVVKLLVTVVFAAVTGYLLRSWRPPVFICMATLLEGAVFITVTWLVARPRPDVVRLEDVTVSSSFPSGHAGAAAAYAAIAVVAFQHTRATWIRALTIVLAAAVPVIVGWARMYRGAHYLTDVVAGILLGVTCVIACYLVMERCVGYPGGQRTRDPAVPTGGPR